jgi:hypothetical protein
MKGTIYKCTFADGKVYIGKSIRIGQRLKEHLNDIIGPLNPGYYDAYQRLGEPQFEILFQEDFTNILEREVTLCGMEEYYIKYYNATDPDYGYNIRNISPMTPGARKAIDSKINDLIEELLTERLRDYEIIRNKLCKKEEPLTPAERYFVKGKFREKNIWQNSIDSFDFNDYNNNTDEEWIFLVDDAIPMIKCIIKTDTRKEVLKYVYYNADEVFKKTNDNPILRINGLGEIKEYQSINDICEELRIDRPDNIRNALNGKQKKAYGFTWIYKNDYDERIRIKESDNLLF